MSKKSSKANSVSSKDPNQGITINASDDNGTSFRSLRELIETLAIALVLAFLFKTFEAEAFVIPTGSMAPTLMGAHKDVHCPQCGYRYQISASEEVDEGNSGTTTMRNRLKKMNRPTPDPPSVVGGTCPQCRFTGYFGNDNDSKNRYPRYEGDRILVYKYLYDMMQPQRWAVTVFRYPGGPQTNFIKRLVGLENETIRIRNGNLFVKPDGQDNFKILRKPARHLLAMLQIVNDNDYVNPNLVAIGWPTSWADETDTFGNMPPVEPALQPVWFASEDGKSFQTDGTAPRMRWLNYRNIVPTTDDWLELRQGRMPVYGVVNNPRLITDFSAYNSGIVKDPQNAGSSQDATFRLSRMDLDVGGHVEAQTVCDADPDGVGFNWDGDLAVQCELDVQEARGLFALRLIKGGIPFLCRINLADGTAILSIEGCEDIFPPIQAVTNVNKPGQYRLRFANIDEQLRLWVNEEELSLERNGEYDELCERPNSPLRRDRNPTSLDLTPVSFGSQGAKVRVNHLQIHRDIYYIATNSPTMNGSCDLTQNPFYAPSSVDSEIKNASVLSDPVVWRSFGKTRIVDFPLAKDQFFMMGDNSAKSMDARVWNSMPGGGQYVQRDQLIGRAAAVYWPHGYHLPYLNEIPLLKRVPFLNWAWVPNPGDMRFID